MTTRSGSSATTVSMSKLEFMEVLSFSVAASRSSGHTVTPPSGMAIISTPSSYKAKTGALDITTTRCGSVSNTSGSVYPRSCIFSG